MCNSKTTDNVKTEVKHFTFYFPTGSVIVNILLAHWFCYCEHFTCPLVLLL